MSLAASVADGGDSVSTIVTTPYRKRAVSGYVRRDQVYYCKDQARATTSGSPISVTVWIRACLPSLSRPVTIACVLGSLSGLLARDARYGLNCVAPRLALRARLQLGLSLCDCRAGLALVLAFLCYVHSQVSLQQAPRSRCALGPYNTLDPGVC